jgi:general secretion pathway protein N
LSLVGTVLAGEDGIGIFFEAGNQNVLRLKTGEGHKGWLLRSVQHREVVFKKGKETAVLSLPARDIKKEAPVMPGAVTGPAMTNPIPAPPPSSPAPVSSSGTTPPPASVQPVSGQPATAGAAQFKSMDELAQTIKQRFIESRPTPPAPSR